MDVLEWVAWLVGGEKSHMESGLETQAFAKERALVLGYLFGCGVALTLRLESVACFCAEEEEKALLETTDKLLSAASSFCPERIHQTVRRRCC